MTKQEVLDAANVMIAYANGKKVGTRPRRSMEPLLKILYVPTWNWEQKDYCMIPDDAGKESLEQSEGGKAVSDTPISDSTAHNVGDLGMLCRRLERELNAANSIIRQQQLLDEENLRLKKRIKMLEVVERLATAQMDYIQQLETENDAMRADLLLWNEKEVK